MKRFFQVLMTGVLTFGSIFATAADTVAQSPQSGSGKADPIVKSKSRSAKVAKHVFSEGTPEDDRPMSRKEIEEMREALGEK